MTGRDRLVIVTLVGLLLAVTTAIGAPAFQPAPSASSSASPGALKGYREGILGHPNQINPLTATTQADRDLVALIFSGLTRLGPDGTILPDLAERWSVDDKGLSYTFTLRSDATWQDGEPLTSADVLFTIETLQNPAYQGAAAASWAEVHITAVDSRTVRFTLATPVAGFLTATTQPLLPLHLLGGVPPSALSANPFSQQPIGSGPFRLVSWDPLQADLVPTARAAAPGGSSAPPGNPGASPSVGNPAPGASPSPRRVVPYLPSIQLRFYTDPAALAEAYRAGGLDAAVGLPPAMARDLGALPGSRLVRYPRSTLTGIVLNLRVSHRELRDSRARVALLQAIDRAGMIDDVLAGNGTRADSLIPPTSWAFDPSASAPIQYDLKAAAAGLKAAGWKQVKGRWVAPGGSAAYRLQLVAPEQASNPIAWAAAQSVAADWRRFGLTVDLAGLSPAVLIGQRLQPGQFTSAAIDINVGLDPDLYPFLASTQATTTGSNVSGIQQPALDKLLEAARQPGTVDGRKAAFRALESELAKNQYVLPLFFRDEVVALSDRVQGPAPRQLGDPADRYWDVLTWRLASGR